jgi:hypothetical protein
MYPNAKEALHTASLWLYYVLCPLSPRKEAHVIKNCILSKFGTVRHFRILNEAKVVECQSQKFVCHAARIDCVRVASIIITPK